jgi:hypothetical protein
LENLPKLSPPYYMLVVAANLPDTLSDGVSPPVLATVTATTALVDHTYRGAAQLTEAVDVATGMH